MLLDDLAAPKGEYPNDLPGACLPARQARLQGAFQHAVISIGDDRQNIEMQLSQKTTHILQDLEQVLPATTATAGHFKPFDSIAIKREDVGVGFVIDYNKCSMAALAVSACLSAWPELTISEPFINLNPGIVPAASFQL